jgi:hypothetical protein
MYHAGWAQEIDAMILEFLPRYEWVVVGRDSLATDSAGSSLVSAAMKNKQIEIGIAGFDMMTRELAGVPYVMRAFGAAPGWPPDYKDSLYRTALRDDWCTNWPVASSNMISVGGPLANHLSEYFNDFTDVLYGLNTTEAPFTEYAPWVGKFVGLTCWDKMNPARQYSDTSSTGYAEIATYKDINGTVGLMVWGISARDTFYASVWLHGDAARGIPAGTHYLQGINPGVTSLVLKISYSDPSHPTFSIVEHLGTVSEKHPIHWDP